MFLIQQHIPYAKVNKTIAQNATKQKKTVWKKVKFNSATFISPESNSNKLLSTRKITTKFQIGKLD